MFDRIERIEQDRLKKERYWVYLECGEKISLYGDLVVKHSLEKGMEVTRERLEDWKREDESKKSFEMALNYLSYRPRSRKEMVDYLAGKGFGSGAVESAIDKLEKYGYIDDLSFSSCWIKTRMAGKPRGKRLLARELYQKGISDDIVQQALEIVDERQEERAALELASKYMKKYGRFQGREKLYRVGQALARRGFEWELIQRVCRKLNVGQEEGE